MDLSRTISTVSWQDIHKLLGRIAYMRVCSGLAPGMDERHLDLTCSAYSGVSTKSPVGNILLHLDYAAAPNAYSNSKKKAVCLNRPSRVHPNDSIVRCRGDLLA